MTIEIRVPDLPESVADATVGNWHKNPGEFVQAGEPLVDIETDKVVLEVPAPESGVLAAILNERGNTVLAGQLLAQMQPDDELWEFRSPASTWQHLCGREGLVLLRQGKVVAQVLTAMN
mgnify:FL=1